MEIFISVALTGASEKEARFLLIPCGQSHHYVVIQCSYLVSHQFSYHNTVSVKHLQPNTLRSSCIIATLANVTIWYVLL